MNEIKTIQVPVDTQLKKEADALFSELGFTTDNAIDIFLRQALRFGGFPFDIRLYTPNEETIAAITDAENGINLSKTYTSFNELIKDLNAEN